LAQIGAYLLQLFGITQTINALLAGINTAIQGWRIILGIPGVPASRQPGSIYGMVSNIQGDVVNGTWGLQAAHTERMAILGALGAITPTPPAPPPSASDNANAVWQAIDPFSPDQETAYGAELGDAFKWALLMRDMGSVPAKFAPFFNVSLPPPAPDPYTADFTWPTPDWDDIQPGDTLLSWLERTCPNFTWDVDARGDYVRGYHTGLAEDLVAHYTSRLTMYEWAREFVLPRFPPVWPGEAYITRGASIPLAQGVVIVQPMDGAELYITATDRLIPFMSMDTFKSYRSLGRYAFMNDAGDLEQWSGIPADVCQLLPRQMAHAAGLYLSFYTGVTGIVTPFTINQ
jgi:hypothetical protein